MLCSIFSRKKGLLYSKQPCFLSAFSLSIVFPFFLPASILTLSGHEESRPESLPVSLKIPSRRAQA